jgi:hypothetical protein
MESAVEMEYMGLVNFTIPDESEQKIYRNLVLKTNTSLVSESTDDLEESIEYLGEVQTLKLKKGDSVGFLYCADDFDDSIYDTAYSLDAQITFINDGTIQHNGEDDATGEVSSYVIMLNDKKFLSDSGEFSIITKKNQDKFELDNINKALGKDFKAIIWSMV